MVRSMAVTVVLSYLATSAWALAPSAPGPAAIRATEPARPAARNQTPRITTQAARPSESGPCQRGVIPIAGNRFAVRKAGFTRFDSEYARVRVDGWDLDDLVVERVRKAASGIAVRRIAFDKAELSRAKQQAPSLFRTIDDDVKDFARHVSAGANCEHYLVVHTFGGPIVDSSESVHGMGIVNVRGLIKSRTYLFAITYIRIYDGHSFETIKHGAASTGDEPLMSLVLRATPFRGPKRELDEASFPATPAQAATNPALREGVRALLAASLDKTLPALLGR
jgi:hypothetical protein